MFKKLSKTLTNLIQQRFFKYAVVGVSSTLLDTVILAILVEVVHSNPDPAKVISQIFAITNGYILNKKWTFKDKSNPVKYQFLRFIIINIIGVGISLIVFRYFRENLGIWYLFANILTAFVVLVWNFNINRIFTFK